MSVSIKLYINTTENNRVDKSSHLSDLTAKTVTGSFRTPVDILNPTVLIDLTITEATKYNYMYIADFKRYYFITDIVLKSGSTYSAQESSGLFEISGHVDVLYSYKMKITACGAFVARNASNLNPYIRDPMVSFKANMIRTFKTFSGDPFKFDYDPSRTLPHDYEIRNIVMVISNNKGPDSVPTPEPSALAGITPFIQANPYGSPLGFVRTAYVMTPYQASLIIDYLNTHDNIFTNLVKTMYGQTTEAIISFKVFPFDVYQHNPSNMGAAEIVKLGDTTIGSEQAYPIERYYNQVFTFGNLDLTSDFTADFRSYEPFRTYELYLPYIGWIQLDASDVSNTKLGLKYVIDVFTGDCEAIVFNYNDTSKIFKTEHGKIGFDVPITSSNAFEIAKNEIMNIVSMGTGIAAGIATGGASGIAMAGSSVLKSGLNIATNPYKQTGTLPSSTINFWMPSKAILIVSNQEQTNYTDITNYRGHACYKEYTLSTLSGYTEVETVHLENMDPATSTEVGEIEQLLKSGVIL